MNEDEIRAAVRRAIAALPEDCYDDRSMEYGDNYPCPRHDLLEVAAVLDVSTIEVGAR